MSIGILILTLSMFTPWCWQMWVLLACAIVEGLLEVFVTAASA